MNTSTYASSFDSSDAIISLNASGNIEVIEAFGREVGYQVNESLRDIKFNDEIYEAAINSITLDIETFNSKNEIVKPTLDLDAALVVAKIKLASVNLREVFSDLYAVSH